MELLLGPPFPRSSLVQVAAHHDEDVETENNFAAGGMLELRSRKEHQRYVESDWTENLPWQCLPPRPTQQKVQEHFSLPGSPCRSVSLPPVYNTHTHTFTKAGQSKIRGARDLHGFTAPRSLRLV